MLPALPELQSKHGLWRPALFHRLTAWYLHSLLPVCSHFPLASAEEPAESRAICWGQPEDVDSAAFPTAMLTRAASDFPSGVQGKQATS